MANVKTWPREGDRLVHRFRKKEGEVVAEVLSVDRKTGKVAVRVGKKTYPSLSAAASAVTGRATNGWVFWGLKKQEFKSRTGGRSSGKRPLGSE